MEFTESVRSFQVPATPCTSAWPPSLPSVPTSRATRVTSEAKERQLVHHGVDGVLQLQDLALDVHRDLLGQVARRHRRGHVGDVAHLGRQVARHEVHRVGQVLPGAGHALHLGLAAQLALGAHLARHPRHFGREGAQLLHHLVDDHGGAQEFAFQPAAVGLQRHRLGQVALRHGADHASHLGRRMHQVADQRVDRFGRIAPEAGGIGQLRPFLELALLADDARQAGQFLRHAHVLADHLVEGVGDLAEGARPVGRQLRARIALLQVDQGLEQVAGALAAGVELVDQQVDGAGLVLPQAGELRILEAAAGLAAHARDRLDGPQPVAGAGGLRRQLVELGSNATPGTLPVGRQRDPALAPPERAKHFEQHRELVVALSGLREFGHHFHSCPHT